LSYGCRPATIRIKNAVIGVEGKQRAQLYQRKDEKARNVKKSSRKLEEPAAEEKREGGKWALLYV